MGRRKDIPPENHVTVRAAAEMLGVSETAVRQRIGRGTLPTMEDGPVRTESGGEPRYYIPVEALERAVAEKEAAEEARDRPPAAGIFLHRPGRPKTVRIEGAETVRVETGPEGVEIHLDG